MMHLFLPLPYMCLSLALLTGLQAGGVARLVFEGLAGRPFGLAFVLLREKRSFRPENGVNFP